MATIVVDVRPHARPRIGGLAVDLDELPRWTGEILRLAHSDLDAPIIVLGSTLAEAERAAKTLRFVGFGRVRPWSTAHATRSIDAREPVADVSAR
jgi:rhodanese-related sulfurtransferase